MLHAIEDLDDVLVQQDFHLAETGGAFKAHVVHVFELGGELLHAVDAGHPDAYQNQRENAHQAVQAGAYGQLPKHHIVLSSLSRGSGCCLVYKSHVLGGHEFFDIDDDDHAFIDIGEAVDVGGVQHGAEVGRRANLFGLERRHVGHGIDDHADDAAADVEDDHHGELVVGGFPEVEADAHVDDRDDHAAHVDDTLQEGRRVGDLGHRVIAADLLHVKDVQAVFFLAKTKCQEFPGVIGGGNIRVQVLAHLCLPCVSV